MLVFSRNKKEGDEICRALADRYEAEIVIYGTFEIEEILSRFDLMVAVMATGIIVRLVCRHLKDKWTDVPIVSVDSSLRCAVPVIGGHHGANDLALHLAKTMKVYPAITTATDAAGKPSLEGTAQRLGLSIVNQNCSREVNLSFLRKDVPVLRLKGPKVVIVDDDVAVLKNKGGVVVGLGARRGVSAKEVVEAVVSALESVEKTTEDIRVIATAWIKEDEAGISEAAEELGREVVYLGEETLNAQDAPTPSRAADLGLVGVAEPAAMALSMRLIMQKKVYGRVTVALGE